MAAPRAPDRPAPAAARKSTVRPPGEAGRPSARALGSHDLGERYEVFPETAPLRRRLDAPLRTPTSPSFRLLAASATEPSPSSCGRGRMSSRFAGAPSNATASTMYPWPPCAKGVHDLVFRIESAAGREEIPGGKVKVGTNGRSRWARGPPTSTHGAGPPRTRKRFRSSRNSSGRRVSPPPGSGKASPAATCAPPRGSERPPAVRWCSPRRSTPCLARAALAAPGLAVARGAAVFRLQPSVESTRGRSPRCAARSARSKPKRRRPGRACERLEGLLRFEARQPRGARAGPGAAQAGSSPARRGASRTLAAAPAARPRATAGVDARPARAVERSRRLGPTFRPARRSPPGTTWAALMKTSPGLAPARPSTPRTPRALGRADRGLTRPPPTLREAQPLSRPRTVRFVSRAAEIDRADGHARRAPGACRRRHRQLPIGSMVEVEILLPGGAPGIVIPALRARRRRRRHRSSTCSSPARLRAPRGARHRPRRATRSRSRARAPASAW